MVKKQIQNKVLILFITLSFFLSIASISLNNLQRNNPVLIKDHKTLEMALPDLPYWAIRQNATEIYRLFESINFTINSFNLGPGDADHATMQIDLSNGSTKFLDMNFIGNNKFRAEYNPNYNAPLGFQNVSFLVYNATNQLLNSHRTYTNFTILTNYMVNLNNSMYYIGDTVYGELLVSNFQIYDFTWNTTIVDSLDELIQNETKIFDRNIYQFSVLLKNETFRKNRFYYVQLNMTDKNTERKETAYFPFYVRNNKPLINGSIRLSPEEVFRTEDFTISFNVTDIESKSEDLVPWMYIYDAEGELVIQNRIAFDSNNLFSETFNIPANRPIGKYRVNITLRDPHGAFSSKITYLNVKNNAPEIHSYKINGLNMNKTISIFYGRNLVFTFNVSDIEGLAYIEVALLNENDEWFNITKVYTGENTEIIFRTFDLVMEFGLYIYMLLIQMVQL
ncbi:MAG: hypothetical protein ACFFE5_05420 [Candidatus Thorarchaeota archaeon]